MRHERTEARLNKIVRIFAIGYEGVFTAGTIELSPEHTEMKWADMRDFEPENYFTGGWLKGVQEYLEIKREK